MSFPCLYPVKGFPLDLDYKLNFLPWLLKSFLLLWYHQPYHSYTDLSQK